MPVETFGGQLTRANIQLAARSGIIAEAEAARLAQEAAAAAQKEEEERLAQEKAAAAKRGGRIHHYAITTYNVASNAHFLTTVLANPKCGSPDSQTARQPFQKKHCKKVFWMLCNLEIPEDL